MADRSLTLVFLGHDASAGATAEAIAAKLKALEAAENDTSKSGDRLSKSHEDANNKGFKPLLDTALLLGPAIVPIGAAAVAASVGLVGMGAAGVLAFKGIQREIKQGTELGRQYQAAFHPIVDEFHTLEHVAAAGVFDGINRAIQNSRSLFPGLNKEIGTLSLELGNIAGNVGGAFVNIFHQLAPLFGTLATQLDHGSAAFLRWSKSSDGIGKFVQYAQGQLPVVEQALGNLATAIVHIGEAAGPLGGVALTAISNLAAAINRIPLPVLTGLLVTLQAGRIVSIAGGLDKLAASFLTAAAGEAGFVAAGAGLVTLTAGFAALALGAGVAANAVQDKLPRIGVNIQQLESTLNSLDKDYGKQVVAFGDSIKAAFENGGSGAQKLALQAAVATTSLGPVSTALMFTGQNVATFAQALTGSDSGWSLFKQNAIDGARAAGESGGALTSLGGDLDKLRTSFVNGKTSGQDAATALSQLGISADGSVSGVTNLTAAQQKGMDAAQKKALADQAAAVAMQQEGDAAGSLTAQLNILNDTILGATDANLGFRLADLQLQAQLKSTQGDLRLTTQAGLQNNQAISQAIKLAEQDGAALTKSEQGHLGLAKATQDGTNRTLADLQALRAHIIAVGGDTKEIDTMIAAVNKTPAGKQTTFLNNAPAEQAKVAALDAKIRNTAERHDTRMYAIDDATPTLSNILAGLASIPREVVTYVRAVQEPGAPAFGRFNAQGTSDFVGGWSWVGERGPELMRLPAHTQILSNSKSVRTAAGQQRGGDTYAVTINVAGSVTAERDLVSTIRAGLRDQLRSEGKLATVI